MQSEYLSQVFQTNAMINVDRETTVPHITLSGCTYLHYEFYLHYIVIHIHAFISIYDTIH